jgi:hypothetical protein
MAARIPTTTHFARPERDFKTAMKTREEQQAFLEQGTVRRGQPQQEKSAEACNSALARNVAEPAIANAAATDFSTSVSVPHLLSPSL